MQVILNASQSNRLTETSVTSSSVNTLPQFTLATAQSKCTYSNDITIYIDAFEEVAN